MGPLDRRTVLKGGLGVAAAPAALRFVSTTARPGHFPLVRDGAAAPLVVSADDHPGVVRVAGDLRADVHRVTGVTPVVSHGTVPAADDVVLIGTIGASPLIDPLVQAGKLDVHDVAGRWESWVIAVVDRPRPGVRRALVIAGSDQRGTIYGAYEISRQIGVSPWYWWDDVPPRHRDALFIAPGRHPYGPPAVKYRGFFINDEYPALATWERRTFGPGRAPGYPGGFNHAFYATVFELMLRLRANYLWPAVWGRAFAEDDPANHATASRYGIVMGTSHEAPMMRGIEEWNRHAVPAVRDDRGNIVKPGHDPYGGTGEWSFRLNRAAIEAYWRDGIRRMVREGFEGVVTVGMRGNGDTSLPDGDAIDLMREIIAAERRILADVTHQDPSATPQVWTLYKEVQRYWDTGLRAPDDVTVVWSDDNWGNLRKLPDPALPGRAGGYGLYYHFDYVGAGRNYKWVDTNLLPNVWEQLHQAYAYGIDRLWVVNVGDLKNVELPLQFFLDYSWDPDAWPVERLGAWERRYAAQNFGEEHAAAIAGVLHTYAHLQARRKPELLNRRITVDPSKDLSTDPSAVVYDDEASPFSLTDYRELEAVTGQWRRLADRARRAGRSLPADRRDAYHELVGYEVEATANLYALRLAEFTGIHYAAQGRAAANRLAGVAEARFADDRAMSRYYNTRLAGGKWRGWQTQPKIDYGDVARYGPDASWQEPERDGVVLPDKIFPAPRRVDVPAGADMGVAIDGSDRWWPDATSPAVLPALSPYQTRPAPYIEVFNRGATPFDYRVRPSAGWVRAEPAAGRVREQIRLTVRVDWSRAPAGRATVPIAVHGPDGATVTVRAVIDKPDAPRRPDGFVEASGYVAMEADHYTRAVGDAGVRWTRIPDIGRTGSGMTPFPVTAASRRPDGPRLEYAMTLFTGGKVTVWAYLSPRNNVLRGDGIRYAVSIDDDPPQVVNVTTATGSDDTAMNRQWARNTSDNVNRTATTHTVRAPGRHMLRFWMVDPTVVVQRLIVDTGGLRPSYLGPPESLRLRNGRPIT